MSKSYLNNTSLPRGLRNNNLGNIRFSNSNDWVGKIPFAQNRDYKGSPSNIVREFEQFVDIKSGLRAKMIIIYNYVNNGHNTIEKIINRFAPPIENNTASYIATVVRLTGIAKHIPIVLTESVLISLCKAILFVENGSAFTKYVTDADYNEAVRILGRPLAKKKV